MLRSSKEAAFYCDEVGKPEAVQKYKLDSGLEYSRRYCLKKKFFLKK